MERLTRVARWTAISRSLFAIEDLVDRIVADPEHPDKELCGLAEEHVHGAASMACMAIDGDYGVDPPPRGAARSDWASAKDWLRGCKDAELMDATGSVSRLIR